MEYFINKAFNKLGHETINIDFRNFRDKLSDKFIEIKEDFDLVFLQRGDYFPLDLIKAVNRQDFFGRQD